MLFNKSILTYINVRQTDFIDPMREIYVLQQQQIKTHNKFKIRIAALQNKTLSID